MDLYRTIKARSGGQWPTYQPERETSGLPHGSSSEFYITFRLDGPHGTIRYVRIGWGVVGAFEWKEGTGDLSQEDIFFRTLLVLSHVGLPVTRVTKVYGLFEEAELESFELATERYKRAVDQFARG